MHDPRAGIQPDRNWLAEGFPGKFPIPGRSGVPRAIDDQRIGDTVLLPGFAPGTPAAALPKQRILDVSLQRIAGAQGTADAQWQTGSWELAIQANITKKLNAAGALVLGVVPIVAKIRMGTGSGEINVEVSPFPSAVIPLPCDHVTVEVTWDSFRLEDYGTVANSLAVPEEVSITATVQRSTGSSDARRVFVAKPDAIGVSLLARVPAMAKRAMLYSNASAEVYAAGALWRLRAIDPNEEITTGTASVITTYTGAELGAIRNQGALSDVPGAARWWLYTAPTITAGPVFVDFEIGL